MQPLCRPLLVASVGKTDATVLAAEQRGSYLRTRESSFMRYPFSEADVVVFVLCAAVVVAALPL